MAGFRIEGNTSNNVAEVNSFNAIKVATETDVATNPGNVGGIRAFGENDRYTVKYICILSHDQHKRARAQLLKHPARKAKLSIFAESNVKFCSSL